MYMRVDVGFPGHEKAVRAGGDAVWMWLSMKVYAKVQATDGRVPGCMIGRLQGPDPSRQKRLVQRLVVAGLVDVEGHDYRLHDYLDWEESSEQAADRQSAARRRKADYDRRHRGGKERGTDDTSNGVTQVTSNAVTNAVSNTTRGVEGSGGEIDPPTPLPEEPTTPPRDPMAYLSGGSPQQRPDVVEVFRAFVEAVGQPNRKLRRPGYECPDAAALVEALDTYGLDDCLAVAREAPRDGMVNGSKDDKRERHDSVRYVFGNPDAFARILRAAKADGTVPGRKNAGRTMAEVFDEARRGGVE